MTEQSDQPTPADTKQPEDLEEHRGSGPPPEHDDGQDAAPNEPKPDLDDDPER